MHHKPESAIPCTCTMLRKATRALARSYDDALSGTGITINQFALLRNIARLEMPELSRLADHMVMERTSLYRAITPMEKAGWIAIEMKPRGRAKTVRLTFAGQQALQAAEPAWMDHQAHVIDLLGEDQWRVLEAALGKLPGLLADGGQGQ